MEQANSRVALVTGANKDSGFEVARQLGKAGCTVVIGARCGQAPDFISVKFIFKGDGHGIEGKDDRQY
jgi:NAD(P)-dependent dehydrogenase (short-subunit alcohol dehydrogenase family)